MVRNEIILGTIKKMFSSGVDDDTVKSTLKDIGLNDSEIDSYIEEAKGRPKPQSVQKPAMQSVQAVSGEAREKAKPIAEEEPEDSESDAADEGYDEGADEGQDIDETDVAEDENLRGDLNDFKESQELGHSATHMALEGHSELLDELSKKLDVLSSMLEASPSLSPETVKKIGSVDARLSSLEREMTEVKALAIALQDILKKILDTDRQILNRLEKK